MSPRNVPPRRYRAAVFVSLLFPLLALTLTPPALGDHWRQPSLLSPMEILGDTLPGQTPQAFLPIVNSSKPVTPTPAQQPTATPVSPRTPIATPSIGVQRDMAVNLFSGLLLPPRDVPAGFTGDVSTCNAGAISAERLVALTRQINYFRLMAGAPEAANLPSMNHYAQAAAGLMGANRKLDHFPTSDWKCFSADGAFGAEHSNLAMSMVHFDPEWRNGGWILGDRTTTIENLMRDDGPNNMPVGHRHWLLGPVQAHFGIGEVRFVVDDYPEIPNSALEYFAGAVTTLNPDDDRYWNEWPRLRDGFLAWPPAGYVPYPVVFSRWSLHFPPQYDSGYGVEVHLDEANVQMWIDGVEVPLTVVNRGTLFQTLVWEPALDLTVLDQSVERHVQIRVRGIKSSVAAWREIEYSTILFTP